MNIYQPIIITDTIVSNFLPTRLCIKKISNIYYFCKSVRQDILKYKGSGTKWKNIIKKNNSEKIQTIWVSEWYYDVQEIHDIALHFSIENDIVNSDSWANLVPEWGIDSYTRAGSKDSEETRKKKSIARTGDKNPMYGKTDVNSPHYGKTHDSETKKKQSDGLKKYNLIRPKSHCENISKSLKGNLKLIERSTGDKNPGFKGYYISPNNERFDSSRKAAKAAGVKDKSTLISWAKQNKNGWSFQPI